MFHLPILGLKHLRHNVQTPQSWAKNMRGRGQETSEKQAPSALEFVALFNLAIDETEKAQGKKQPLHLALTTAVNDYNKTVAVRKWRVDANKKKLLAHLLRCPPGVLHILAEHFDQHKHATSGAVFYCFFACKKV